MNTNKERHLENLRLADKTRWRGVYYEHGVGNPGTAFQLKKPVEKALVASVFKRIKS